MTQTENYPDAATRIHALEATLRIVAREVLYDPNLSRLHIGDIRRSLGLLRDVVNELDNELNARSLALATDQSRRP